MNPANFISGAVRGLVSPIMGFFEKREDRKRTIQTIHAKTAQARQEGETKVTLNESEWELIGQRLQGESWKDEFVTLVVFAPLITAMLGSIFAAFGHPELSQAAAEMMRAIADMDINYGQLMYITALAALGLRAIKQ